MRNLRHIRNEVYHTSAEITSVCWDPASDEILATFGPTEEKAKIDLVRVGNVVDSQSRVLACRKVASWDALSPNPELPVDKVVSTHHFSDNLTTCIVLAGGDVVVVREKEGSASLDDAHVEIVGSIDAGITAARWSPDEDLLAISTQEDTLVFMSRGFDGVATASMSDEDLKLSKHVSVGWGKKETQFQGKGAKALRDPTIPEKVDQGTLSFMEDGRTTLSWRGDGAFVALNSIKTGSRRVIRVYNREAVLDSVSEPVDGLEGSISWRPAGNLIAGIQRFVDRVDVVFFERNGLRHGQFTLPDSCGRLDKNPRIDLEWNSDSTVLAAKYADMVQLWTMGNYHWYLKQEVPTAGGCSHAVWHPEKPLPMAIAAPNDVLLAEFAFAIANGAMDPPNDHGAVAVIDGKSVKITPFRTVNIPPPMSMCELTVDSNVIDVAFSNDNSLMAVLHHTGFDVYCWKTQGSRFLVPTLHGTLEFSSPQPSGQGPPLQLSFSGRDMIHILHRGDGLMVTTHKVDLTSGSIRLADSNKVEEGTIMAGSIVDAGPCIQDRSGRLFNLIVEHGSLAAVTEFPIQLPWSEVVRQGDITLAFGLSRSGHLYANTRLLTKSCTSFVVTPEHLVITTSNHLVKLIHLDEVDDLEVPPDDPETDERCRSIERGARLVTAVPTNMSLVMQMPRGNLETIYPRAMVVGGIRKLVNEKEYGTAFSHCRTQRVDMNILYDHRPDQFIANSSLFLSQLRDVTSIDLFLSSLKEEDVTQTMYRDTRPSRPSQPNVADEHNSPLSPPTTKSSKVNTICNVVLRSLHSQKNANLQNIITAHVCKVPPALDDGLRVVAELMHEAESLAESAVEHICFLVDVNRLYDHALGLYNLDLTLLVAQQSQRDPREYLPFVHSLHSLPELRRKFTIDDHLGRREKALGHLQTLNSFEELQEYTTKHGLYQTALGLYRYDETHRNILTDLYAAHLESTSKFREAGLAYESLGNFPKATACYQSAGPSLWRECLFTAHQQAPPLPPAVLADLAGALADALLEAKDYTSAATIQHEYLASLDTSIRSLCTGHHFAPALRLLARHSRPDLLPTFDAALLDALSSSTDLLADCKAQLRAQVPRIAELRAKAASDPLAFLEGDRPAGADLPDDISVAASALSTSASLFTRYTASAGTAATGASKVSTARGRRREAKKRARGRRGTVYEEEYLVGSVRRLVARVGDAQAEVERLVVALVRRGMGERARAVEGLMGEVGEACRVGVGEVWSGGGGGGEKLGAAAEGGQGGEGEEEESEETVRARMYGDPPVLKSFSRLSLLG